MQDSEHYIYVVYIQCINSCGIVERQSVDQSHALRRSKSYTSLTFFGMMSILAYIHHSDIKIWHSPKFPAFEY